MRLCTAILVPQLQYTAPLAYADCHYVSGAIALAVFTVAAPRHRP